MNYDAARRKLESLQKEYQKIKSEIIAARRSAEPQEMKEMVFTRSTGEEAGWEALFSGRRDLILIHNMGRGCAYCTLWADGFNGVYEHLASRAAFAVVSPDTPEAQKDFAASRAWRFPMITYRGTTLAEDTGYGGSGGYFPGVSVFVRRGGKTFRISDTRFSPGDLYCGVWHLFDLLPDGSNDWRPKFSYAN
jgi:predicted dithiol-disulfide oxidoreductase (DUF899 family)